MLTVTKIVETENVDTENQKDFDDVDLFLKEYDKIYDDRGYLFFCYESFLNILSPHNLDYDKLMFMVNKVDNDITFCCVDKRHVDNILKTHNFDMLIRVRDLMCKLAN